MTNSRHRDPDPISAVLAILGAVGSIASVVAVVDSRRSERARSQRQARDDLADIISHLASAEAALAELSAVAARLALLAKISSPPSQRPRWIPEVDHEGPAFGEHGLFLVEKDLNVFLKLQDDAFRQARQLQKELSAAFRVIYRSETQVLEEDFQRLVRVVARVNSLLRRHGSAQDLLVGAVRLCDEAGKTIHQLRELLAEAGGLSD